MLRANASQNLRGDLPLVVLRVQNRPDPLHTEYSVPLSCHAERSRETNSCFVAPTLRHPCWEGLITASAGHLDRGLACTALATHVTYCKLWYAMEWEHATSQPLPGSPQG